MDYTLEIQQLLQHYQLPDVKATGHNGDTLIHSVVKSEKFSSTKKIEILQILRHQGLDFHTKNRKDETVLHLAMKNRATDIIDFLLILKRVRENNFQHSVITCLIESERDTLLELEKEPEISDRKIQNWECESASFVEWIMSKGFKIGASEGWALSMAIKFNLQHILPILLKYTTDIDKQNHLLHQFLRQIKNQRNRHLVNSSSIWYSFYCERFTTQIVKDLLSKGFVPEGIDANRISALHMAIDLEERIDIVKMLIERSKNINHKNRNGETAFYMTINNWIYDESNADYYRKIAKALVDKGADVNESKNSTDNPLIIASRKTKPSVVKFLAQCETDFNVTPGDYVNLIHALVHRNCGISNVEVYNQLLDIFWSKGCDLNAKDMDGRTPLHVAAGSGPTKIVQKLIEHKAHVNCQDNQGYSTLHHVAKYARVGAANLLLKSGALVSATDSEGNTPLQLAILVGKGYKLASLYIILLKYGAELNEEFSTLSMTIKQDPYYERRGGEFVRIFVDAGEEYLFKHWMKLKAANLKCAGNNLYRRHTELNQYRHFLEKCLTEIEKLKRNFIDGPVSLYTFLQMDAYSRIFYINNKKLKNIIGNEVALEKNFPEYSTLILGKYREAVTKKLFMQLARNVWLEKTKIVLPDLCIECIISFLNNSELFNLLKDHNQLENINNVD